MMIYRYHPDQIFDFPDPNPECQLDSLLSSANWIERMGVERDSAVAKIIQQHLVDAHAEIVKLRAREK